MEMFVRMTVEGSGQPPWQRTYAENCIIDTDQLQGAVPDDLLNQFGSSRNILKIRFTASNVLVEAIHNQPMPIFLNRNRFSDSSFKGPSRALLAGENEVLIICGKEQIKLILIGGCSI